MQQLIIYTIYKHPSDYPQDYVCRRHLVTGNGSKPEGQLVFIRTDLESIREELEKFGLINIGRTAADDAVIVESWI